MAAILPSDPAATQVAPVRTGRRWPLWLLALFTVALLPFAIGSDYLFSAILVPLLILSLAGLGLNVLTGYAGQLSLGSAAFMAVGAFATYNLQLRLPGLPMPLAMAGGGIVAAGTGLVFGLPSLRVKGFYLIASTLAAQFFIPWLLSQYSWFANGNDSGVVTAPPLKLGLLDLDSPAGRYALTLTIVALVTWGASNLVRGPAGRAGCSARM